MLFACLAKLGISNSDLSFAMLMFLSFSMGVYAFSFVTRLIGDLWGVCKGDNISPLKDPAFFTMFTVSTFSPLRLKISF